MYTYKMWNSINNIKRRRNKLKNKEKNINIKYTKELIMILIDLNYCMI